MQGLEATQVPPGFDDPGVFEERHQKVLVIACQGDNGGWPLATRKLLYDPHGAKTAVDIVAQKHGHGLLEGGKFEISFDVLGHLPQQVVTTVDVADTVDPHAIRDPTLNRSRSRRFFSEPLQERIHPRHEFGPHPLGPMLTHAHPPWSLLCEGASTIVVGIMPPAEARNDGA